MVGAEGEEHDVPGVARVYCHLLTSLHIPGGTGHVPAARHDLIVTQEPTTGQVSERKRVRSLI